MDIFTAPPRELLPPDAYVRITLLRDEAPASLLAELNERYEAGLKAQANDSGEALAIAVYNACLFLPTPLPATIAEGDAWAAKQADNVKEHWGRFQYNVPEALRRMEPTKAYYARYGLDPIDLTEIGRTRRERALAQAVLEAAEAAKCSAQQARMAVRGQRAANIIALLALLATWAAFAWSSEWRSSVGADLHSEQPEQRAHP